LLLPSSQKSIDSSYSQKGITLSSNSEKNLPNLRDTNGSQHHATRACYVNSAIAFQPEIFHQTQSYHQKNISLLTDLPDGF